MGLSVSLRADTIRDLLLGVSSIMTWKTLALVLAVINLKNLPLVWHVSIRILNQNNYTKNHPQKNSTNPLEKMLPRTNPRDSSASSTTSGGTSGASPETPISHGAKH